MDLPLTFLANFNNDSLLLFDTAHLGNASLLSLWQKLLTFTFLAGKECPVQGKQLLLLLDKGMHIELMWFPASDISSQAVNNSFSGLVREAVSSMPPLSLHKDLLFPSHTKMLKLY
jgi:hypothetical protein